jgi:hypothetical protein
MAIIVSLIYLEKCRKKREKTRPFELKWLRRWKVKG